MSKRIANLLASILVVVALLASAAPVFAAGSMNINGQISAVDTTAQTVTIIARGGASLTLTVDANTLIRRQGKLAALADLQVGDRVGAKYDPATMLASRILARTAMAQLTGTIKALDTTAGTLTVVRNGGGQEMTLTVDAKTLIRRLGRLAALDDLQVGDKVAIKYNPSSLAALRVIAVPSLGVVNGLIKSVDTTTGSLVITQNGSGKDVTLTVGPKTIIRRGGQTATLADLQVGDLAHAKYNKTSLTAISIIVR